MNVNEAMNRSQAPITFSGATLEGDELLEWCDDEVPQHAVVIKREWRGLPDIAFYFATQDQAHTLFLALCEVQTVMVDGDAWQEGDKT